MPCSPPDVSDITWRGRLAPRSAGPKRQPGDCSADPAAMPALEGWPPSPAREGPEHPVTLPSKALLSSPVKNGESLGQEGLAPERLACLLLDAQQPPADLDRGFLDRSRLRKVRTLPRLPPDGPESGALCLSLTSVKTQLPASEFFPPDPKKAFPEGKHGLSSFQAQPASRLWLERELELRRGGDKWVGCGSPVRESPPPGSKGPRDSGGDLGTPEPDEGTAAGTREPDRAAAEQVGDRVPRASRAPSECWAFTPRKEGSLSFTSAQSPSFKMGNQACLCGVSFSLKDAQGAAFPEGPKAVSGLCFASLGAQECL